MNFKFKKHAGKRQFIQMAYYKTLLSFWGIEQGSEVTRNGGLYEVKKITAQCNISLKFIRPLSTTKFSIKTLNSTKGCRFGVSGIKTKDGKNLFEAENDKRFKKKWKRGEAQAEKDWGKLQREKLAVLKVDPTIRFENKK